MGGSPPFVGSAVKLDEVAMEEVDIDDDEEFGEDVAMEEETEAIEEDEDAAEDDEGYNPSLIFLPPFLPSPQFFTHVGL